MNFYNSKEYFELIDILNRKVYSKCDINNPSRIVELNDEYIIKVFYYENVEIRDKLRFERYRGSICYLYKNDKKIYEWKITNNLLGVAKIINHSDGNKYLIFNEDLYGYSVLNLSNLESIHYIPFKSHKSEKSEETFIWLEPYYNKKNNYLAVYGCYWGPLYSVILLDFSNPMQIVDETNWIELCKYVDYEDVSFEKWDENNLICRTDNDILNIDINKLKEN